MATMLKMAGGGDDDEMSLDEFIIQAEEYRESGDVADQVFKVLNLMGQSHPFYVLRLAEIRSWIEEGRIRPDRSWRIRSTGETRTRRIMRICRTPPRPTQTAQRISSDRSQAQPSVWPTTSWEASSGSFSSPGP